MPVIHTGSYFENLWSTTKFTELSDSLSGLGVSSELLESTYLKSAVRLDIKKYKFILPDYIVENLYCLYNYDTASGIWSKITDYTQRGNELRLKKYYKGILIAVPLDAFEDVYDSNQESVYEFYLANLDSRVYRNIEISSSSFFPSKFISLQFSFSRRGPWSSSIFSPYIFDKFYVKVISTNIELITSHKFTIPSENISLTCLVCE